MSAVAIPEARFPSGGRQIEVETFRPAGRAGLVPAVIFLRDADGIEAHGKEYRKTAAQLAGHGFAVLLAHYFDRTGTGRAGLDAITSNSPDWMSTVSDAIGYAAGSLGIDRTRIALLGTSLGASLARRGTEYEAEIYPGQGHVFTGAIARASVERTAEFFAGTLHAIG